MQTVSADMILGLRYWGCKNVSESVIVALITGLCAVLGQWLISRKANIDKAILDAKREQKLEDRLKLLEDKIDEHNNYGTKFGEVAEKFGDVARDIAVIRNDIKTLYKQKGAD